MPTEFQRREPVESALEQRLVIVCHCECAEREGLEVGREEKRLGLVLDFGRPPQRDQPVNVCCARSERGTTTKVLLLQSEKQLLDEPELAAAQRQPDPRPLVIADITFEAEFFGGALEPRGFALVAQFGTGKGADKEAEHVVGARRVEVRSDPRLSILLEIADDVPTAT